MQDGPESPGDTCEVKQREKKKLGKESCNIHDHRKENTHVTKLKGEVKKLEILTIIFLKVLTCFIF